MPFRLPRLLTLPTRLHRRARRNRLSTMLLLLLTLASMVLALHAIYKPPASLIAYFQRRWPAVLWRVRTERRLVALTIDDAPSEYTAEILQVLRDNGARATFFVIGGQTLGKEQVLAEVVREGHELGNHAMHDEPSRALSDAQLGADIEAVERIVALAYETAIPAAAKASYAGTHAPPRFFRPGSGFFSARMLRVAGALGYRVVLGDVYPHDAQIGWAWLNARHVLSMVRPGSIVICHDRRGWTVPMLKKVLPELRRRGYEVVSVSTLLRLVDGKN